MPIDPSIIEKLDSKFNELGHDPNTFLKGLLHSSPINYWDYIQVDTLLSLQRPKTNFKDEYIFIVYHQVTELIMALIAHEIKQIIFAENSLSIQIITEKINRANRYAKILESSFDIMREGMDYSQYNTFRLSLAPASGFQAVSFRMIELYCTDLINLVRPEHYAQIDSKTSTKKMFSYLYWQEAGIDRKTGKKSLMLKMFEEKYLPALVATANECKKINLNQLICSLGKMDKQLATAFRNLDYTINVKWPMAHLKTAEHYLIASGHKTASTGMSDWQKYLHPAYQRRIFFPSVWNKAELKNWGNFSL